VPTATALAFRPHEAGVFGTLAPDRMSVVSAEFTCQGEGVPDLGRLGLMVLAMAIVAAAVCAYEPAERNPPRQAPFAPTAMRRPLA